MKKTLTILLMSTICFGCTPKKPAIIDPCDTAPASCYGQLGQAPADVAQCAEVVACHAWELRAQ